MLDELTGMYNLRFFRKQLRIETARTKRSGFPCSLIIFDIDHFKRVNDTYGHPVGDQAIKEVTRRILRSIRSIDYAARLGGEEFSIILPSTRLADAVRVGDRVRKVISESPFHIPGASPVKLTVSGGVAEYSIHLDSSPENLLKEADGALYRAKRGGKSQISYIVTNNHETSPSPKERRRTFISGGAPAIGWDREP